TRLATRLVSVSTKSRRKRLGRTTGPPKTSRAPAGLTSLIKQLSDVVSDKITLPVLSVRLRGYLRLSHPGSACVGCDLGTDIAASLPEQAINRPAYRVCVIRVA